jgi:hypothetical protein
MIDFSKVPPPAPSYDTDAASMPDPGSIVDLDLPGAKRALAIFNGQIAHWEAEAQALVVDSPESARQATEMVAQIKRLAKQIDDRRKEIIEQPDKYVRTVNGWCKPFADRLKALEAQVLKRKMSDYMTRVELARREAERKQREAAARLQAELDAEAAAKGVEPVQVAPVVISEKQGPTRSDTAVSSAVMTWKHRVTDQALVPRQYLMVDDAAIRAAIRGGIRHIDGVEIYEEADIRVRRTA